MPSIEHVQRKFASITRKYGIYIMFVLLIVLCSLISPVFLTYKNLMSVARQISVTGILAFCETLLIIAGVIDLSLGSVLAFSGMVAITVYLPTGSFLLAFLAGIAVGIVCSTCSALLITKIRLPAFIATMSMDLIARGSVYIYTDGQPIYQIGDMGKIAQGFVGPIPVPVLFLFAVAAFCWVVLSKTRFGRSLYAVGGNAEAANASGISVSKTHITAFVLSGIFVGMAGVLQMARLNSGLPDTGMNYHGDAIAAAVIGGTSFTGGLGTAQGTLVGAFIIGLISNILNLMGVQSYVQQVVKGLIIVLAVGFDLMGKAKRVKKLSMAA